MSLGSTVKSYCSLASFLSCHSLFFFFCLFVQHCWGRHWSFWSRESTQGRICIVTMSAVGLTCLLVLYLQKKLNSYYYLALRYPRWASPFLPQELHRGRSLIMQILSILWPSLQKTPLQFLVPSFSSSFPVAKEKGWFPASRVDSAVTLALISLSSPLKVILYHVSKGCYLEIYMMGSPQVNLQFQTCVL